MPPLLFGVLDLAGTVGRLMLVLVLADALAGPVSSLMHLIIGYQGWLVGLSLALGGGCVVRRTLAQHASRRVG